MHLNEKIVNLSTPLTHPRFFVLAEDLTHESQALFGLIIDDSEAFRSPKLNAFERSKDPPVNRRQGLPLRETKNSPSKMAVYTVERPIFNNPFFIDFSTLFSNIVLYVP